MDRLSDSLESWFPNEDHIDNLKKQLYKLSDYADYMAFRSMSHLIGVDVDLSPFIDDILKRPKSRHMILSPDQDSDVDTYFDSEDTQYDSICHEDFVKHENRFIRWIFGRSKLKIAILTALLTCAYGTWRMNRRN